MTMPHAQAIDLKPGEQAPPLVKIAHNTSTASENKIHDDGEARRLGLRGGLVPGVTLYAYLTEHVLPLLGPAWLERGYVVGSLRASRLRRRSGHVYGRAPWERRRTPPAELRLSCRLSAQTAACA